jgi:hypothetical protein
MVGINPMTALLMLRNYGNPSMPDRWVGQTAGNSAVGADGVDGVILGCTELPLFVSDPPDFPCPPILNAATLLADAVDRSAAR